MSDQVFYLFSAVLLGLVLGALFMYFASGANKDSDKTIKDLEKKLNSYQEDVSSHFEETADLVDELTNSYKKVFDHLGKSARKLMTEEQIQHQLERRKGNKVTLEFLTQEGQEQEQDTSESFAEHKAIEEVSSDEVDDTSVTEETSNTEEIAEADSSENADDAVDLEQEVEMREKNIYT